MDPKFQIFVSSTYQDLKEPRQEVIKTILLLGHIPVSMEYFPAGNEDQWTTIKGLLDGCDYYVIILGGNYGTIEETTGKSYTQLEYEYATEKRIPVASFIHKKPEKITTEGDDETRKRKLGEFAANVKKKSYNYWLSPGELSTYVATGLLNLIKTYPRLGWVRANFPKDNDRQITQATTLKTFATDKIIKPQVIANLSKVNIEQAHTKALISFVSFLEIYFVIEGLYSHSNTEEKLSNAYLVPIRQNNIPSHHHQISELWQRCYNAIHHFIRIVEICKSDSDQKEFELVSRLHISYIYFCMANLWGDVPYIDAPIEIPESANISRTNINRIRTLSIKSLTGIVDDPQIGTYYVFAIAMLAKWEIYAKNYAAALGHLKKLFDIDKYQLESKDQTFDTNRECLAAFDTERETSLFKGEDFLKLCKKGRFVSYMRYTEILLMASEASFGLEDVKDATYYLNMVKQRNGKSPIKENDPELLTTLLTEWKEDLGMEGSYFAALKRNSLAEETLNIVSDRLVLPIPMKELIVSPSIQQNAGY